ncbi:hypothetical protein PR048_019391 [Dryococelus australis]|uniref:Uncharacterized protein n=1 Tax=Dryococelus australis TaxID=614101 RepID=A0ABQ9H3C8_9NEOP|nr:hypothetical protein PR048_019391 [Dryococelus australis]
MKRQPYARKGRGRRDYKLQHYSNDKITPVICRNIKENMGPISLSMFRKNVNTLNTSTYSEDRRANVHSSCGNIVKLRRRWLTGLRTTGLAKTNASEYTTSFYARALADELRRPESALWANSGSLPDTRPWLSCRTMPLVGRDFLGDLPFPPPLHSGAAPCSPRFTLTGSQHLDIKDRPYISTPLPYRYPIKLRYARLTILTSAGHRVLAAATRTKDEQHGSKTRAGGRYSPFMVHAALRGHRTPVQSPKSSGDCALVARVIVTLIAPAQTKEKIYAATSKIYCRAIFGIFGVSCHAGRVCVLSALHYGTYYFAPEENTQIIMQTKISNTPSSYHEYELRKRMPAFDLNEHRAETCIIANCSFRAMKHHDIGPMQFVQGDTLKEHTEICKDSSTGSQQVLAAIPLVALIGTDSTADYDETVNTKYGMSVVESVFVECTLARLSREVNELQNKRPSALNRTAEDAENTGYLFTEDPNGLVDRLRYWTGLRKRVDLTHINEISSINTKLKEQIAKDWCGLVWIGVDRSGLVRIGVYIGVDWCIYWCGLVYRLVLIAALIAVLIAMLIAVLIVVLIDGKIARLIESSLLDVVLWRTSENDIQGYGYRVKVMTQGQGHLGPTFQLGDRGKTADPRENPLTSGIVRHDARFPRAEIGKQPFRDSKPVRRGRRRAKSLVLACPRAPRSVVSMSDEHSGAGLYDAQQATLKSGARGQTHPSIRLESFRETPEIINYDSRTGSQTRVLPNTSPVSYHCATSLVRVNIAMRLMALLILHKAKEYTTCTQVDLKQGFQKCSLYQCVAASANQVTVTYEKTNYKITNLSSRARPCSRRRRADDARGRGGSPGVEGPTTPAAEAGPRAARHRGAQTLVVCDLTVVAASYLYPVDTLQTAVLSRSPASWTSPYRQARDSRLRNTLTPYLRAIADRDRVILARRVDRARATLTLAQLRDVMSSFAFCHWPTTCVALLKVTFSRIREFNDLQARFYSLVYKYADINCALVVYCHNGRRQLDTVLQDVSNTVWANGGVNQRSGQWLKLYIGTCFAFYFAPNSNISEALLKFYFQVILPLHLNVIGVFTLSISQTAPGRMLAIIGYANIASKFGKNAASPPSFLLLRLDFEASWSRNKPPKIQPDVRKMPQPVYTDVSTTGGFIDAFSKTRIGIRSKTETLHTIRDLSHNAAANHTEGSSPETRSASTRTGKLDIKETATSFRHCVLYLCTGAMLARPSVCEATAARAHRSNGSHFLDIRRVAFNQAFVDYYGFFSNNFVQWHVVKCCKARWCLLSAVHSRGTQQEPVTTVQPKETQRISTILNERARDPLHTSCGVKCRIRLLTSHQGKPGSIPGRFTPGFSHLGIVPDDAAGRRVCWGDSLFSRPCIPAPLHSHLISSSSTLKDLDVESRPNLNTLRRNAVVNARFFFVRR